MYNVRAMHVRLISRGNNTNLEYWPISYVYKNPISNTKLLPNAFLLLKCLLLYVAFEILFHDLYYE